MKIFASLSVPIACDSLPQSRSPRNPPRSRCASIRASAVSMRRNSCSFDISRLNMPTVMSVLVPTCCAMFSTRLVLPIDGRAATMMRSDGCRPEVISSRSVKPVGTPVTSSLRACSFSMVSRLRLRQLLERDEPVADLVVGDREDGVLGLIEDDVGVLLAVVGSGENLVGREDQTAEGGLLLDDAGVVLDVGRARHAVHERGDVGRTADFVEVAGPRASSSFSVTRSIASPRSASLTILSKMRR